ncbi:MAG: hypothetical protein SNJ84_10890 [Verrucomicrobiia bacterium]
MSGHDNRRRRRRQEGGITRREVVVVVLLLVVVGLIAVPMLIKQREGNARLASLNNLQQWGIAFNLFLIENDNRLPQVGMEMTGEPNLFAWYNALPVYLSQRPLGEMAAEERPRPGRVGLWKDPAAREADFGSPGDFWFAYGMNRWLQPDPARASYKIYEIADPGATVFLAETASRTPGIFPPDVRFRHVHPRSGEQAAQVLFCDGHAAAVGRRDLVEAPGLDDPQQPLAPITWIPFFQAPRPK